MTVDFFGRLADDFISCDYLLSTHCKFVKKFSNKTQLLTANTMPAAISSTPSMYCVLNFSPRKK